MLCLVSSGHRGYCAGKEIEAMKHLMLHRFIASSLLLPSFTHLVPNSGEDSPTFLSERARSSLLKVVAVDKSLLKGALRHSYDFTYPLSSERPFKSWYHCTQDLGYEKFIPHGFIPLPAAFL